MLQGVYCPSITPFNEDGSIAFDIWTEHLNYLIDAGIDGILIFGSIGEFYALSTEEKKTAIEYAAKTIAGRTTLLVGTGSTRFSETVELNKHALLHGADAAVVVSPYYFGPSDAAATNYFGLLAEATELPLVLYNFPDRTGNDLHPDLLAELASKHSTIIGVKDTIDSAAHNRQVITAAPKGFSVLSGFDEYYLSNRIAGGSGVLSGLTNVVPEVFVEMHKAYEAGDLKEATARAATISTLMGIYNLGDHFISAIKEAVSIRRGNSLPTATREPSIPLTEDEKNQISALLDILK